MHEHVLESGWRHGAPTVFLCDFWAVRAGSAKMVRQDDVRRLREDNIPCGYRSKYLGAEKFWG